MLVRHYEAADKPACLAVFDSNMPKFFEQSERPEFAAFLDNLPGPYLVILDTEDRIVACGGYAREKDGYSAAMCWGMVHQDLHGTGLGLKLTTERLDAIRNDPSYTRVYLNTSQHTVGFYEKKLGFEVEKVEPNGYGPNLDRYDMRLDL